MERVEMALGRHTLSIETGRMAKQADGAVLVRLGDTVVLATACAQREPRRRDRLPAPDGRLPREQLRGRQDPRRLLQARGPAEREGDPHLPHDRPPAAAALPRGLRLRDAGRSACCSRRTWRTTPTPCRSSAPRPPSTSPTSRSRARWARCASATGTGSVVVNPTSTPTSSTKSKLNLLVAGTEDGDRDGRGGRPGDLRSGDDRGPSSRATRVIKQIVGLQKELRARVGKPKRTVAKKVHDPAFVARSRARWRAPLLEAMRKTKGKLESYARMKKVRDEYLATIPEDQAEKRAAVPAVYDGLREKLLKREILENGRRLDGRRFDEIRPITSEVGVLPAHPRLGALHPRRDPGAGHGDPRHLRGRADHRHRAGARVPQALHAPLQLPALLGGRGEVPARPGPARDRPRRPRRAGAARDAARRGGLPLHDPHRLRHPRVERLVVDGHGLRRHPGPHGRRACPSRAPWPASPWAS